MLVNGSFAFISSEENSHLILFLSFRAFFSSSAKNLQLCYFRRCLSNIAHKIFHWPVCWHNTGVAGFVLSGRGSNPAMIMMKKKVGGWSI